MAGQISAIKKRLQTVNSTKKLTKATELVATVKLQKYNANTLSNEEYDLPKDYDFVARRWMMTMSGTSRVNVLL